MGCERPRLAGKPLFLLGCKGEVGAGAAGAGFDFHQHQGLAALEQEIGLGEGTERAGSGAVAMEQQVGEGEVFSQFALFVGMKLAPGLP